MEEITGHPLYSCGKCRNPVALRHDLLSKSFLGKSGQAYLFGHAMNIVIGAKEERKLITGFWAIFNFVVKITINQQGVCFGLEIFVQMGEYVGPRIYSCYKCRNHVSLHDDIISKAFQGRNGRAFLFSHAMNVVVGAKEDRRLLTGVHTVADVSCEDCNEVLGWKYERAFEESQKYKEGKFILEKSKIVKENW